MKNRLFISALLTACDSNEVGDVSLGPMMKATIPN